MIKHDMPFAEYLARSEVSHSALKQFRLSASHVRAYLDTPRTPTDDMLLGEALHTCFLTPEEMPTRVILWPKRRAGKEWQDFQEEHAGKVVLTQGYYDKMVGMVRSMRNHPEIRRWSSRMEAVEVSGFARINGVDCRGRCDALTDDPLCDLKKLNINTFQKAIGNEQAFYWHIRSFGYDIQGAMYRRLFERSRFILFFVEDAPPHDVASVEIGDDLLASADDELDRYLQRYKECVESGVWPGAFPDPVVLHGDIQITFEGEGLV